MVYDYVVTLENRNRRYIDNVSVLLILLSIIFFTQQIFSINSGNFDLNKKVGWDMTNLMLWDNKLLVFGTPLMLILFGISLYQLLKQHLKVQFRRILFIAGVIWLTLPSLYWVGILLIALGLLEKSAKNDLEIGFSPDEIVINSLIKRRFEWVDFNNILLKDDLLTMDFKNNKLLQRLTIDDEADADEDEFNAYCSQHLLGKM